MAYMAARYELTNSVARSLLQMLPPLSMFRDLGYSIISGP